MPDHTCLCNAVSAILTKYFMILLIYLSPLIYVCLDLIIPVFCSLWTSVISMEGTLVDVCCFKKNLLYKINWLDIIIWLQSYLHISFPLWKVFCSVSVLKHFVLSLFFLAFTHMLFSIFESLCCHHLMHSAVKNCSSLKVQLLPQRFEHVTKKIKSGEKWSTAGICVLAFGRLRWYGNKNHKMKEWIC